MRVSPLENIHINLEFPNINERLESKVREISQRKSDKFKISFSKIVAVGSIVLFIVAYNITPDIERNSNEKMMSMIKR